MQIRHETKIPFIFYFLSIIFIFAFGFYLFYLEATAQIASDLTWHLNAIDLIVSGQLKIPHEGFQYTIYVLSKLTNYSYILVGSAFLSITILIATVIKFLLLKRLTTIPNYLALIFSIALMLVSAIALPLFNPHWYIGQGSPNVWHNPTLLCVKPFAFLCTYLAIVTLETPYRKLWILVSILLFLSFCYKPSFGIIFIPALFLYIFSKHTKNFQTYFNFLLAILPGLLFVLLFQFSNCFLKAASPNSIIVSPLAVLHLYTPNVFISFLLATAFPLFFLLFKPQRIFLNNYLLLAWIMLLVGYLQYALLAETYYFKDANFSWGFLIALDLVFVFSFIEFINYIKAFDKKSNIHLSICGFLIALFLAHFFSGIGYLTRYIMTGNFQ